MLAGLVTGVLVTLGALLCIRVISQIQSQLDECMDEVADAA
jgi:Flp pilus assembly pilin Flp